MIPYCDWGGCDRLATSYRFDERSGGLLPVCTRHILAYRVADGRLWQAEDEHAGVRFCRRSRWRIVAQRRLLHDQREALRGRESRAQRHMRIRADGRGDAK